MNRRPDLIVPIRDRRQHKRYLTLRNFAILCAVAFVAFIAVSIYSEVRRPAPNEYGRLARREIPAPPPVTKTMDVVEEAGSIPDQVSADPTLVQPMTRAQWLGEETTSAGVIQPAPEPVSTIQRGDDVVIVGGPEGVTIVKQKRRKPVLSGGFGR
jgi:hypothetical protein